MLEYISIPRRVHTSILDINTIATPPLKRDYIYNIENTDLEIGVSGILLRYYYILMHVNVPDRLAHFTRYASPF